MAAATAPSRRLITLTLLALVCLAAWMRVHNAGEYHVSPDEINHIEMAQGHSAAEVLHRSLFETHPPLGHLIRHYWMMLSDSPGFLRTMALVFGLMLIPLYYRIGAHLSGPWAGICTAALVAFSHGCIIQSYVVRNYTMLLFFLSSALYCYLLWRDSPAPRRLLLYAVFGTLAICTHFCAVFGLGCMGAVETVSLLRNAERRRQLLPWLFTHAALGVVAYLLLREWSPLLDFTRAQVQAITGPTRNWFYPVFAMNYLFVYRASVPYVFVLCAFVTYGLCILALAQPSKRHAVTLAVVAVLAASALVISRKYLAGMNRNSLWLLPFLAPPLGCALAMLCEKLRKDLPDALIAYMLLMLGYLSYESATRFRDVDEYMMTQTEWSDYSHYLGSLDESHLIISSRSDAFLIAYPAAQNLYDFYAPPKNDARGAFIPAKFTSLLPYRQAELLFKPYYFNYSPQDLVAIIQEAQDQGLLADIDTLVFPATLWSNNATRKLMLCETLDRTVIAFPPLPKGQKLTSDAIDKLHALVLIVPKRTFMEQLVSPTGRGRPCLK